MFGDLFDLPTRKPGSVSEPQPLPENLLANNSGKTACIHLEGRASESNRGSNARSLSKECETVV
jgi:hypothetical protein